MRDPPPYEAHSLFPAKFQTHTPPRYVSVGHVAVSDLTAKNTQPRDAFPATLPRTTVPERAHWVWWRDGGATNNRASIGAPLCGRAVDGWGERRGEALRREHGGERGGKCACRHTLEGAVCVCLGREVRGRETDVKPARRKGQLVKHDQIVDVEGMDTDKLKCKKWVCE